MKRFPPAVALFLLAPFIGEYLLGNIGLDNLAIGVYLAPMYGGGALLVREVTRRTGHGWPTIFLLAAAYALIEEGLLDQLIWNDSYAGFDYLHGASYVPAAGTSVEVVQTILALHTVWSICVPIAIIETMVPERRMTPWLRRRGLTVVSVVFVLGGALVFWGNYTAEDFLALPAQLSANIAAVAILIILAFRVRPQPRLAGHAPSPQLAGHAPSPRLVGLTGLVGTSAYWAPSVFVSADWYEWVGVIVWFVVAIAGGALVVRWSRRPGWGPRHIFALAAGATMTYVWTAFPLRPEIGTPLAVDLVSNVVFGAVGVWILVRAARATRDPRVG